MAYQIIDIQKCEVSKTEKKTFIQDGCIKLIKSDSGEIYKCNKRSHFQINAVLLNFLFIKS